MVDPRVKYVSKPFPALHISPIGHRLRDKRPVFVSVDFVTNYQLQVLRESPLAFLDIVVGLFLVLHEAVVTILGIKVHRYLEPVVADPVLLLHLLKSPVLFLGPDDLGLALDLVISLVKLDNLPLFASIDFGVKLLRQQLPIDFSVLPLL